MQSTLNYSHYKPDLYNEFNSIWDISLKTYI